ncbi:MAG: hypothetical protein WC204_10040 [Elusimicrobiales bacterium]|jgi:ribosomal protein S12 methylthiotransferase accessory factor
MEITFDGNKKIDASFHGFEIKTDQPESAGGNNSAPTPFYQLDSNHLLPAKF